MLRAEQQRRQRSAKGRKALQRALAKLLAGCTIVLAALAVLAALTWLAAG
jgi:hypothetical protein